MSFGTVASVAETSRENWSWLHTDRVAVVIEIIGVADAVSDGTYTNSFSPLSPVMIIPQGPDEVITNFIDPGAATNSYLTLLSSAPAAMIRTSRRSNPTGLATHRRSL